MHCAVSWCCCVNSAAATAAAAAAGADDDAMNDSDAEPEYGAAAAAAGPGSSKQALGQNAGLYNEIGQLNPKKAKAGEPGGCAYAGTCAVVGEHLLISAVKVSRLLMGRRHAATLSDTSCGCI